MVADIDVTQSVQQGVNEVFAFIPEFLIALVILVVGYFIAKALSNILGRVLHRAGFDRTAHSGQAGQWVQKVTTSPSHLIARVAFWALMLGVISIAVSVLGIEVLSDFVDNVWAYLPNVIAALLIFLVAGAIAGAVAALATRFLGDTALGRIVATAAPILVMTIATFMILVQLKIAEEIVVTTYTLILGAIALASALAFGLGGRDVARQILEGAYEKGQEKGPQLRQEAQMGKERAREEVSQRTSEGPSTTFREESR